MECVGECDSNDEEDQFNFHVQPAETLKIAVQVLRQILNNKSSLPPKTGLFWTTWEVDDNGISLKVCVETKSEPVEFHMLGSFFIGPYPPISSFACRDPFCCRVSLDSLSDVLSNFQDSGEINIFMVVGESNIMFFGDNHPVPLPVDIIKPIRTSFDKQSAPLYSMEMESLTLMETLITPLLQSSQQPQIGMRFLIHELQCSCSNTFFTLSELLQCCTIRKPEGEGCHEHEVVLNGRFDYRIMEMLSGLAMDVVLHLHTDEQLAWPAYVTFMFSGTRTAGVADAGCSKDKGKSVALYQIPAATQGRVVLYAAVLPLR